MRHFHDLGNFLLAFTILWAYLSFSQFLIIWSGNLPEEIPWYVRRFSAGWGYIAVLLIVFHFFAPFVILLQRFVKRNPQLLYSVAIGMIVIRLVDVYWVVEPAFIGQLRSQAGVPVTLAGHCGSCGLDWRVDSSVYLATQEISGDAAEGPTADRPAQGNGERTDVNGTRRSSTNRTGRATKSKTRARRKSCLPALDSRSAPLSYVLPWRDC